MRFILALVVAFIGTVMAFVPVVHHAPPTTTKPTSTQLDMERRDVFLITGILGLAAAPGLAHAKGSTFFYDDKIEEVREQSQMPTGGKLDLNSAFVVSGCVMRRVSCVCVQLCGSCTSRETRTPCQGTRDLGFCMVLDDDARRFLKHLSLCLLPHTHTG